MDEAVDGTGHCQNGNPGVNCNIYDGKQYVWLNGGPAANSQPDGQYFFAVLVPGGQANPNDGAANNLSDDYDAYTNRTFTVTGGEVSATSGTHDIDGQLIRLAPYADTTNNGGEYILAICSLAGGYPVDASTCKYDAFKIKNAPPAADLVVTKDATASFDRSYGWTIAKSVDRTRVDQTGGGTAEFNYTVDVTRDAGTDSNWKVTGSITVTNFNWFNVSGVDVVDQIQSEPNSTCVVTNGSNQTVPFRNSITRSYTCTYTAAPASSDQTNKASATWPETGDPSNGGLAAGTGTFDFDFSWPTTPTNTFDDCVTVDDTYAANLGSTCATHSFTYSRTVDVPTNDCTSYDNTATFTTNTTGATDSASQTVTVCGPATNGSKMVFWQGRRTGQAIINAGSSTSGVCDSGTWIRQFAPFSDLSNAATCGDVATYVHTLLKAVNKPGATPTDRLRATLIATALNVYFTDPALGGNPIGSPSPVGDLKIDLTVVLRPHTSPPVYDDASSAFGASALTVLQMLTYASSQSGPGGSNWYGGDAGLQTLAKNAFQAVNTRQAFPAP